MGLRSERVGWFSGLLMSTGFILFSCFRGVYTYMGRRVSRNAEQRKGSNDIPGCCQCLDQGSAMGHALRIKVRAIESASPKAKALPKHRARPRSSALV